MFHVLDKILIKDKVSSKKIKKFLQHSNDEFISDFSDSLKIDAEKRKRKKLLEDEEIDESLLDDIDTRKKELSDIIPKKFNRKEIQRVIGEVLSWFNKYYRCESGIEMKILEGTQELELIKLRKEVELHGVKKKLNIYDNEVHIISLERFGVIIGFIVFYAKSIRIDERNFTFNFLLLQQVYAPKKEQIQLLVFPFMHLVLAYGERKITFLLDDMRQKRHIGWKGIDDVNAVFNRWISDTHRSGSMVSTESDINTLVGDKVEFEEVIGFTPDKIYRVDDYNAGKGVMKKLVDTILKCSTEKVTKKMEFTKALEMKRKEVKPIIDKLNTELLICHSKGTDRNRTGYQIRIYDKTFSKKIIKLLKDTSDCHKFNMRELEIDMDNGKALIILAVPLLSKDPVSYLVFSFKRNDLFSYREIHIEFSCTDKYFRRSGLSTLLRLIPIWFAIEFNKTVKKKEDRFNFITSQAVAESSQKLLEIKFGFDVNNDEDYLDTDDFFSDMTFPVLLDIRNALLNDDINIETDDYIDKNDKVKVRRYLYSVLHSKTSSNRILYLQDKEKTKKIQEMVDEFDNKCRF